MGSTPELPHVHRFVTRAHPGKQTFTAKHDLTLPPRVGPATLPDMDVATIAHAELDRSTEEAPAFFSHLTEADFANEDALIEAGKLYGDDADRELADLEAGRHPLQRPR